MKTIPTNAIIEAVLNNNIKQSKQLLNINGNELGFDSLTDATILLLETHGFFVNKQEAIESSLIKFAYAWVEHNLSSTERAEVFLLILDTLPIKSTNIYFNTLLRVAKQTEKHMHQTFREPCGQNHIQTLSPAMVHLAKALHERITLKTHSTDDLKAFVTWREKEEKKLTIDALPISVKKPNQLELSGSCLSLDEYLAVRSAQSEQSDEAAAQAALTLLPLLRLNEQKESTLLAAILQCEILSPRGDAKRKLGQSLLEALYNHINAHPTETPTFNLAIPASKLLAYTYSGQPFLQPNQSGLFLFPLDDDKTLEAQEDAHSHSHAAYLEKRFQILKECFMRENAAQFANQEFQIYTSLTQVKDISIPSSTHRMSSHSLRPYVHPAWFISSMLKAFNIDINNPFPSYGEGQTPIVEWFTTKPPLLFKHLLRIQSLMPSEEDVTAIVALVNDILKNNTGNTDVENNLRTKITALVEKLKDREIQAEFIEKMKELNLFKAPEPVVVPVTSQPTPVPAAVIANPSPTPQTPLSNLSEPSKTNTFVVTPEEELAWMTMTDVSHDHREGFAYQGDFDQHAKSFYELEITEKTYQTLVEKLEFYASDNDIDKEQFAYLKKAINTYFTSDAERMNAIKKLLDSSPDNLDEAAKKNYLLYVLALGRSSFKLHTQKGLFGKQNHFTALNDYLHGKPLDESTRQKFGLFKAEVKSTEDDTKKKRKHGPRKGPE